MTDEELFEISAPVMKLSEIDFSHRFNITFNEEMVLPSLQLYPLKVY